jgi:hypothetical protein
MITWSGPDAAFDSAAGLEDEKGLKSGFQMASPKQIAATMAMPAMAMTMSFRKVAPGDCAAAPRVVGLLRAAARVVGCQLIARLPPRVGSESLQRGASAPQPTDNRQRGAPRRS